jgi:hypothetical protein
LKNSLVFMPSNVTSVLPTPAKYMGVESGRLGFATYFEQCK